MGPGPQLTSVALFQIYLFPVKRILVPNVTVCVITHHKMSHVTLLPLTLPGRLTDVAQLWGLKHLLRKVMTKSRPEAEGVRLLRKWKVNLEKCLEGGRWEGCLSSNPHGQHCGQPVSDALLSLGERSRVPLREAVTALLQAHLRPHGLTTQGCVLLKNRLPSPPLKSQVLQAGVKPTHLRTMFSKVGTDTAGEMTPRYGDKISRTLLTD